MKKIISIVLILIMILTSLTMIVSCNKPQEEAEKKKDEPQESTPTITEDEWAAAFDITDSVFQCDMSLYYNDSLISNIKMDVNANKIKYIEKTAMGILAIDYLEKVDGGHYYYNDETESMDINAQREYTKRFVSLEDTEGEDEFESTKGGPKYVVGFLAEKFDSFSYNVGGGYYYAESIDGEYFNVIVYINDGKLISVCFSDGDSTITTTMSYENIDVVLPQI